MASRKSSFSNRKYIYKWFVFHCYVGLLECISVSFHSVFLWDMFLLLLKIIARSFQLSPSTQKFPGSWGQSQQNILVIHLPSLGPQWQGDTSTIVNLMGTGKAPKKKKKKEKKKLATFFGRVPVDIFGSSKKMYIYIYQHIISYLISSMRNETTFCFFLLLSKVPLPGPTSCHLIPICFPPGHWDRPTNQTSSRCSARMGG